MIQAQAAHTFDAILEGAPTGLEGTIGVRIVDPTTQTTITARTTTGITEYPAGSGVYGATLTAPAIGTNPSPWPLSVLWDTVSGGTPLTPDETFTEELLVYTGRPPTTTTTEPTSGYATVTDIKNYVQGSGIQLPSDDQIQRVLTRAERDIDGAAGTWPVIDTTTGRKFDPTILVTFQAEQLKFATCAQVEYRLLHGEAFFAKAQHEVVRFEDTQGAAEFRQGTLPYVGPKAIRELALGGLIRNAQLGTLSLGPSAAGAHVIGNRGDYTEDGL